jgi:DNA-binding response OmpR family regulator
MDCLGGIACTLGNGVASFQNRDSGIMKNSDLCALLVEDEKLLNWSLAKSLDKWGFDVHPVSTGHEAVEQIEHAGFDIILLDYQLPDVDGLAIARLARSCQPDAVIFLLTAFQLSELPVEAGLIDEYFNKPLDLQQLHQALDKISALRAQRRGITVSAPLHKNA